MCPSNKSSFLCVCVWIPKCWWPGIPCDCLLRAQFITPVHYSICWALSTWIIESDASIINYIVHVHNPHLRVYSFPVKIHCVGTRHTRSYIENKLIYKYIFFLPWTQYLSNLTFFSCGFYGFYCHSKTTGGKNCLTSSRLHSLFFATNIYGMAVLLTVGGWGWVSLISLRRIRGNAGLIAL